MQWHSTNSALRPIRVGVIGSGSMGRNHIRVFDDIPNVELVAVADANQQSLEVALKRRPAKAYQDYRVMLEQENLDAVSIAVPTNLHYSVALAAIEQGVSVLVEKPITSNSLEAQDLIERAKRADVILAVGHIERFNSAVIELQRQLGEGALGPIFQMKARRTGPFPDRIRDVGVIFDLATHDLDLMLKLSKAALHKVYGQTMRNIHTSHEDMLSALLQFDNSVIGSLDINWLTPGKVRDLTLVGAKGMFIVDYLMQDLVFYENATVSTGWDQISRLKGVSEGRMIRLVTNRTEPLRSELESFVTSVRDHTEPVVTGQDGLRALEVAEAILRSSESGVAVDFKVEPVELVTGGVR